MTDISRIRKKENQGDVMAKKTQAQIEFKAVTSDFNKGIVSMNKDIKGLNGALRLNAEQLKGNAEGVDTLKERQKLLEDKYAAVTKKVELTEKSLQTCKEMLGESSNEYRNLTNELNKAKTVQQQVQNEINQTTNKIDAMAKAELEVKSPLNQLNNAISAQEKELQDLKTKYTNVYLEQGETAKETQDLKSKINALSSELNSNKAKLKQAEGSLDNLGNAAEDAGKKAEISSDGYTVVKDVVADLAGNVLDEAIDKFKELALESEASLDKLQAKIGASNTEMADYSDIAQNIYKNGWGESLDDVTEALGIVITMTDDLDKKTLQNVTENAMTLCDIYGMDYTESMRAVNSLMDQFGITANQAYNLIVQGAQNGLNQNDDLLDTINEYSVQFANAGYSADNMFNMLKNGADTGTWSIDKLGDAVKEYNIRMTDGTANEALQAMGLNVQKVTAEYAKGGESAQQATQKVIQALMSVDDPQKRYMYGQQIMGTMWEDLGEDAVRSLMNTNGEISKTTDAMGSVKTDAYDNLKTSTENLGRTVKNEMIQPLENRLSPVLAETVNELSEAAKWMTENKGAMIAIGSVIGVVATAIGVYNAVQAIKTAMDAAQVTTVWALVAAHLAQAAAAMAALAPYILIVAAIAAVIAIIVVCVKHWDTIKAKVTEVAQAIKEKVTAIKDSITQKFTEAKEKATEIFENIKAKITEKITQLREKIQTVLNAIKDFFSKIWNAIVTVVLIILEPFIDTAILIFNKLKAGIQKIVDGVKNIIQTAFNLIKQHIILPVTEAKNKAVAIFNLIKSKITATIDNIKLRVQAVFLAIYQKIYVPIERAKLKVVSIFNTLKSNIASRIESIRTNVTNVFNSLKEKITTPINKARDGVQSAVDKIKSYFNVTLKFKGIKLPHIKVSYDNSGTKGKIAQALGLDGFPKLSVDWYAKGGFFPKPTILPNAIGIGDSKGGEYALPLNDTTLSPLAEMINKNMAAQGYNNGTEELLKGIYKETRESNQLFKERMIDALVNGVDFVIDNRELVRVLKKYG